MKVSTISEELNSLAKENGVTIRFTSAVGGGIPWLYNLKRSVRCDNIYKIMGIMNGTTNFILDAMISQGRDFDEVLKEAQALGYAEANPSADIDGLDTGRKTAISSSIAFNTIVKESDVAIFTMRTIKKCDIDYITGTLGKTVRYMGFGIKSESGISTFVEPTLLDSSALEANVNKNFNMITLFGNSVGRLSFYGQGAGKYPTGNALAQDIIDIVNGARRVSCGPTEARVDNSLARKKYYIRTSADVNVNALSSVKIDNDNYIITNEMSVCKMHELAKIIWEKDPASFFAGIEE